MSYVYQDPANWASVHQARHSRPPETVDAIVDWIHDQHIPTSFDVKVKAAVDTLLRRHRRTTARSLAISAPEDTGKTAAVMAPILNEVFASDAKPWFGRDPHTHRLHIPWVYIRLMTGATSASVLRETARFCGIPDDGNEDTLGRRLAKLLPEHGVKAIVVDEAQTLRRASATSSRLPDGLRGLQHLPIPFVFVGIDLGSSALLRDFGKPNDSVRQVRKRTSVLDLSLPHGAAGAEDWKNLIGGLGRRLRLIEGFDIEGLRSPGLAKRLAHTCGASPGLLMETLKNAAADAMETDRRLTTDIIFDVAAEVGDAAAA